MNIPRPLPHSQNRPQFQPIALPSANKKPQRIYEENRFNIITYPMIQQTHEPSILKTVSDGNSRVENARKSPASIEIVERYRTVDLLSENKTKSRLDKSNRLNLAQHSTNAHVPTPQSDTTPSAVRTSFVSDLPTDTSNKYLPAEYIRENPTVIENYDFVFLGDILPNTVLEDNVKETYNLMTVNQSILKVTIIGKEVITNRKSSLQNLEIQSKIRFDIIIEIISSTDTLFEFIDKSDYIETFNGITANVLLKIESIDSS
jgi:hypothetical protein